MDLWIKKEKGKRKRRRKEKEKTMGFLVCERMSGQGSPLAFTGAGLGLYKKNPP
jgi:hypothetical protein